VYIIVIRSIIIIIIIIFCIIIQCIWIRNVLTQQSMFTHINVRWVCLYDFIPLLLIVCIFV